MKINRLYNMDCREGLQLLEDDSIDCCITSPPYWSLRDYNVEGSIWDGNDNCEHEFDQERIRKLDLQAGNPEFKRNWRELASNDKSSNGQFCLKCGAWKGCLGLEPDFNLYIKHLCNIFDIMKQKLKKTGTCWVNLGDTYSGGGRSGSRQYFEKGHKQFGKNDPNGKYQAPLKIEGYKSKCLLMIPQRFALEMINRGWILRNVIIWHKNNPMPSSARDRFTVDFEYVYFFVKSKRYYFDQDTVREPLQEESKRRAMRGNNINKYTNGNHLPEGVHPNTMSQPRKYKGYRNMEAEIEQGNTSLNPKGRNKRCVWTINTRSNPEAHFATFNPDLVRPMILSGCPQYICKKCGKPRERIIKSKTINKEGWGKCSKTRRDSPFFKTNLEENQGRMGDTITEQIGWSDCGCNAGFEPGIVCDPFAGTGTTLLEAWKQGRNYIGFEISKEYCEIANKYLENETRYERMDKFIHTNGDDKN